MLSRALKGQHRPSVTDCGRLGSGTSSLSLAIHAPVLPHSGVGSFGEETLFDLSAPSSPAAPRAPAPHPSEEQAEPQALEPLSWIHDELEEGDDEENRRVERERSSTATLPVAVETQALEARSHQSIWREATPTTSAPTISSILASGTHDDSRHSSFNVIALSAVNMAVLAEDEEWAPASSLSFGMAMPRLGLATRSASMPRRSAPLSIAGSTALTSARGPRSMYDMRGRAALVHGSLPAHRMPAAGSSEDEFQPPHELAAASYREPSVVSSLTRRQSSTADRLKAAVFEQTGHVSHRSGNSFLA